MLKLNTRKLFKISAQILAIISCCMSSTVPKINNGVDALPNEFPFHVSIQFDNGGEFVHVGSGIIVSPSWVVISPSAGMSGRKQALLRAVAGITDICSEDSVQVSEIAEVFIHPSYEASEGSMQQQIVRNDIGLSKLATPFEFTKSVQPVKLPDVGVAPFGDVVVSGWGETGTQPHCVLQKAFQQIISWEECSVLLTTAIGTSEALGEGNICAKPARSVSHACFGDGGVPLVQNGTLVAIQTYVAMTCSSGESPTVYTQISSYMDFITEHVTDLKMR